MNIALQAALLGIGATLIMDIWAILQKRLFNIAGLDYRLVGRWLLHMTHAQFIHHTILNSKKMRGEIVFGWSAHYLIGMIFCYFMLAFSGSGWLAQPTFIPALLTGIISVCAPFFIMQPGFGFGVAASHTPAPAVARRRSLIAHTSFGIGIYITALLLKPLFMAFM